jgi:DNA-binding phage protein
VKRFKQDNIDFRRCILRACRIQDTSMAEVSKNAGKSALWLTGIAHRNSPTLNTMLQVSEAFGIPLMKFLVICENRL